MFILANGAFKSGSTWLRNILWLMTDFEEIPPPYQDPRLAHWVDVYKMKQFLDDVDYANTNYISKSHIHNPRLRDAILSHDNVRVFDIERDLRDVLVSYYYHQVRQRRLRMDFERFYWLLGRYKAYQILQYHAVWDIGAPNVYITSFEKLKNDFDRETAAIADYLGLTVSASDIEAIKEKTSLARQQKDRGEEDKPEHERFFRKGIIGDWKNHFTPELLTDLEQIQSEGFGVLDRVRYDVIFTSRLRLKEIVQPLTKNWRG
jgi:hypothetical protein